MNRPWIRAYASAVAITGLIIGILLLQVFVLPVRISLSILFALPVLLATRFFRLRASTAFAAQAICALALHSWLEGIPIWVWAADAATIAVITALGVWTMEQSRARARLADENARLAAEQAREAQRMRLLAESGSLFGSSLDSEQVLRRIETQVVESLGDVAVLFLLDEAGSRLRVESAYARDPEVLGRLTAKLEEKPLRIGEGLAGKVVQTGESVLLVDVEAAHLEPRVAVWLNASGVASYIAVPLLVHGQAIGVLSVGIVGGERRFGEDDLRLTEQIAVLAATSIENARLYEQALRLASRLDQSRRERELFLGSVTHEIAGVVAILSGYAQLLARDREQPSDSSDRLVEQTRRLSRLLDDLHDLSRIERGALQIERRRCDLALLARRAVDEQQVVASQHRIVYRGAESGIFGCWDCDRLAQVLGNLVRNAVHYSSAGSEVTVSVEADSARASVAVTDRGVGIAPEDLTRLFEPYSRLDGARDVRGMGLGLFISKAIVEAHDGRVEVRSELGQGSTFTVYLPADGCHCGGC